MGLFFAKNKAFYCTTLIKGLGDNNGIVIVTAWLFAGVFGKLMVAGGLVNGLLWSAADSLFPSQPPFFQGLLSFYWEEAETNKLFLKSKPR